MFYCIVDKCCFVMTVLKLTKSGKAVLIIDDFGNTYITSKHFIQGLLWGKAPHGFITTLRLPSATSESRFTPSALYDPLKEYVGNKEKSIPPLRCAHTGSLDASSDGLSDVGQKERDEITTYSDKDIEW